MCRHYDVSKAKQCREPVAEPVQDKTRANFCDWFQPRGGPVPAQVAGTGGGRAELDALFGGAVNEAQPASDARRALDDLFKP
jgi:hypothetical protein